MVSVKKRTFFFGMFLWTLRLQFSLSCRKVSAKLSKKNCSRSEFEKNSTFSKNSFFLESGSSGQLQCSFEHFPKTFLPIIQKKLFCNNRKKTWFFQKKCSFQEKLLPKTVFQEIRPRIFRSQSEKSSVIKLFSKQMSFLKKFALHEMWSFGNSVEASCQISKANCSKSVNFR